MRRKRREPVTITAFAPTLLKTPSEALPHAKPKWGRNWCYLAALTVAALLALVSVVWSVDLRSFASAAAPDWSFSAAGAPWPRDPTSLLAHLQREAQAGDPEAQLQLGILYGRGDGVELDYEVAAKWFRAAADQGLPRAQFDMGVLYERGRGVQIDNTKAARWYLKAAEGGYPPAEYNLAVFYANGQGIDQDLTKAALWYRRAALQGVVQAMTNLAVMYDKSQGVPASPADAYAWYLTAAGLGNHAAEQRAGEIAAVLSPADRNRAKLLAAEIAAAFKSSPQIADKLDNNADRSPR